MKHLLILICLSQFAIPSSMPKLVVERANKYIYVRETTANRGIEVDYFNRTVGNPLGSFWCLGFIYTCHKEASEINKVANPLLRTGRVAKLLKYATKFGTGLQVINPNLLGTDKVKLQVGDMGCLKSGGFKTSDIGKDWSGHIFLIDSVAKTPRTIEGNTNKQGSRNGDRVAKKYRKVNTVLAFIRISKG